MRFPSISLILTLVLISLSAHLEAAPCTAILEAAALYRKNPARELAELIKPSLTSMRVDENRIKTVARIFSDLRVTLSIPNWNWPPYLPASNDFEDLFAFYLVINSLNYKYFINGTDKEFIHQGVPEAVLMATRIAERWNELKANRFQKLVEADEAFLRDDLFYAEVPLPLLKSRVAALREIGSFLRETHQPQEKVWEDSLRRIKNPAAFACAISSVLPTWKDEFLKRSQLLMFMVIGRSRAVGLELFDTDTFKELTVAADYMLPRVLTAMGILLPSCELQAIIRNRELIQQGSRIEREIRGATVSATEMLIDEMRKQGAWAEVTPMSVDALLWLIATGFYPDPKVLEEIKKSMFVVPLPNYHQTVTTDY